MTRLDRQIQDGWKRFGLKIFLSSSCQQTFQENCVLKARAGESDRRTKKKGGGGLNISSKHNKLCYIGGHHVAALDRKTLMMATQNLVGGGSGFEEAASDILSSLTSPVTQSAAEREQVFLGADTSLV